MPFYEVECVDRETGVTQLLVFDAADERLAIRYANDDGWITGGARRQSDAEPYRPISKFRPTFRRHVTPKIARATATGALILAIGGPIMSAISVLVNAGDSLTTETVIYAVIAGLLSLIPFGLLAIYLRMFAELFSILFDIYRLLRGLNSVHHR